MKYEYVMFMCKFNAEVEILSLKEKLMGRCRVESPSLWTRFRRSELRPSVDGRPLALLGLDLKRARHYHCGDEEEQRKGLEYRQRFGSLLKPDGVLELRLQILRVGFELFVAFLPKNA